jgi:hypothetical protein
VAERRKLVAARFDHTKAGGAKTGIDAKDFHD